MDSLTFDEKDLAPIEIPVKLGNRNLVIVEAPEGLASKYQSAQMRSMKMIENADGSKTANITDITDTQALLLSFCLFEVTETGGRKTIPLDEIKRLPHRIVQPLFEKAEEISGLKMKETEETLTKRLKDTQDKLTKIRKDKGEDPKN